MGESLSKPFDLVLGRKTYQYEIDVPRTPGPRYRVARP
jgi:hypothetical protein